MSVAACVRDVPGFGWAAFSPALPDGTEVRAGQLGLDNSLVTLEVDPTNGTFSVNGLAGLDLLVDGGDEGDTYNYCPPRSDTLIDRPDSVDVELVEAGPVRGLLEITRRFGWPAAALGGRRIGREIVDVVSLVELRAGEQLVRVTTRFDNRCRDHRLRARFPLPHATDRTVAECAFSTVTRGAPEGGPKEPPVATFPSRRFVSRPPGGPATARPPSGALCGGGCCGRPVATRRYGLASAARGGSQRDRAPGADRQPTDGSRCRSVRPAPGGWRHRTPPF